MAKIAEMYAELGLKKDKFDKGMKEAGNAPQQLNPKFAALGGAIAAAFSVGAITAFTRQIITVTAEFQKYRAVLANTLGSQREAEKSMQMLTDIASKTPFSVQELTSAYVKLVNQGFKPSSEEMIKLGDLASSTGKSFDQLAEAVIDATTGQFERLKEFGIKAEKNGDMVAFSFKGVRTEVEYTNEAIQKYMLSLGDVEGVSGSMAAISETLGGKISNLGDTWDQFLLHLGDNNNSTINGVIDALSWLIRVADKGFTFSEEEEYFNKAGKAILESADAYTRQAEEAEKAKELAKELIKQQQAAAEVARKKAEEERKAANERKKAQDEALQQYKDEAAAVQELRELQQDLNDTWAAWFKMFKENPIIDHLAAQKEAYQQYTGGLSGQEDESYVDDIPFNTEAITNGFAEIQQQTADFAGSMNAMLAQIVSDFIITFSEGLADLATGDIGIDQFFNQMLSAIGGYMQQMGKMLVAYGIAMKVFKDGFKMNPIAMVVAGAALVVLGGMISNAADKGIESGGGSTSGMSGSSGGTGGYSGGTYGHYNDKYNGQQLVATVDGTKLKIMLENVDRTSARQGRL